MPPRISVVTVCWNALPALRRTAESVLSQECPDLEYWIVDGGSTDGTVDYLAELETRGVHAISEPDRGISDAMNKGIRLASGEWIAHLHAGDEYLPGALSKVASRIRAQPAADVVCGYLVKREPYRDLVCRCAPEQLPKDMTLNHAATWVRRRLFCERGFDERYRNAMDYDLFLGLHLAGARFEVIPEPLAFMEYGGQSERSLWRTLAESHMVRRRLLSSGWTRTPGYLGLLYARGAVRRMLQKLGLGRLVAWYRRHHALVKKV